MRTERTADLGELERRLQLADGAIKGLNPELRRNATPPEPYEVKVPRGMVEQVAAAISQLPQRVMTADVGAERQRRQHDPPRPSRRDAVAGRLPLRHHRGRSGGAQRIAERRSDPPGTDAARSRRRQIERQRSSGGRAATASAASGGATTHRVRQGDNLWLIAQRYGTTVERIKRDNGLRGNLLKVGQKLVIGG